jgi:hypothetical protein
MDAQWSSRTGQRRLTCASHEFFRGQNSSATSQRMAYKEGGIIARLHSTSSHGLYGVRTNRARAFDRCGGT